jgi:hypothetical protein
MPATRWTMCPAIVQRVGRKVKARAFISVASAQFDRAAPQWFARSTSDAGSSAAEWRWIWASASRVRMGVLEEVNRWRREQGFPRVIGMLTNLCGPVGA